MITLVNIVKKLEKILNGTDTEITTGASTTNFFFKCYSEGLYLTDLHDQTSGKNFIPVIVGALGGEYNPVPDLKEVDYNVQIQFFYPVRFKNYFYELNDFFRGAFVGRTLNYEGDYCLSNISVAQFGELQNLDMKEFSKWITNTFKEPANYVMETYMSMTFTLYLSTASNLNKADGFVYGNSWENTLAIRSTISGTKTVNLVEGSNTITLAYGNAENITITTTSGTLTYVAGTSNIVITIVSTSETTATITYSFDADLYTDTPIFTNTTDVANSEPAAEQILDTSSTKGIAVNTSYAKELPIYVKNNTFYKYLLGKYLTRDLQTIYLRLKDTCSPLSIEQSHDYFIQNMSIVKAKGELLSIVLNLSDRI